MTSGPVLVTGATGNVGREVLRALAAVGVEARAAMREPARGAALDTAAVEFDFERPETFAQAAAGARGVFLLRPPAIARVANTVNRFVDVAVGAGVKRFVFLSIIGADRNPFVPHHAIERHLMRSGVPYSFLRAGFFAQNLGDQYRADIRDASRILLPCGSGRVSFVDVRDLAEVAARAFASTTTESVAWPLTGPEAVSFADVAEILTEALGRPVRYEACGPVRYLRHLRGRGLALGHASVITLLHLGIRYGQAANVDSTLHRLLDRPPRSIRDYVRDHAHLW